MPSVKSYQNRKKEVSILQARVRVLESQLNREKLVSEQNLEAAKQNHGVELKEIQNKVFTLESIKRILTAAIQIQAPLVDALSKANHELERKIRIYRAYIRNGEAFYPEHHTITLPDIPTCLKPLDALEYIGKKIENGPDNLSQ